MNLTYCRYCWPLAALLAGCGLLDPRGETLAEGQAVVDATGQPVPHPELHVLRVGAVGSQALPGTHRGDAQGKFRFRFQGEEGQEYELLATAAPGYVALRRPALRGGQRNQDLRPTCLAPAWVRIRLLDEPPRTLAIVSVQGYLSGQLDPQIRYPRDTTFVRQIYPKDENTITAFIYINGMQSTQRHAFRSIIMDTVSVTFRF